MATSRRRDEEGIYLDVSEYYDILDALGGLEKAANRQMRLEAEGIASDIMVPAIRSAISAHAGFYAHKLNQSVRTRQDRIPSVKVGNSNRYSARGNTNRTGTGVYSGGATTNMIRFGTIKGEYTSRSGRRQLWAYGIRPGWTDTADAMYAEPAFAAWTNTANKLVDEWNRGRDY